ncbi:fumarylacetoacetate hydrolase [Rhodococcus sp. SRB_17]|nr:fumarylacetoacetate hydrolase [Rhodococcus sp. SRB_17]
MRLFSTDHGLAREDKPGTLSVLDLPFVDVGALLRGPGIEAARSAAVLKRVDLADVEVLAPIFRPGKVLIVGLNYPSHGEEAIRMLASLGKTVKELPAEPNFQVTAGSSVTAPTSSVVLPSIAPDEVDYEGELALIIGSIAKNVAQGDAWSYVAGLSVVNDVSARDIQKRAMSGDPVASIGVAKSFDTFSPMGPCVVTADEFDPDVDLRITTRVNGQVRQDDRTSNLIHSIPSLIAYLSTFQTLEPGDVICTGTPSGAGIFSGRFLSPGDVVEVEIEKIGVLRNPVVAAP